MDEEVEVDDKVALALTDSGHLGGLCEAQALSGCRQWGMDACAGAGDSRGSERRWLWRWFLSSGRRRVGGKRELMVASCRCATPRDTSS